MNKRSWLVAGVGAAAALAGVVWQQQRDGAGGSPAATGPAGAGPDDDPVEALWRARFERPDGTPLVMATLRGEPLVLNFWATWCPPCVKEMPELDRFARQYAGRGVRVVGLAIDRLDPVRAFLARTPVAYAIGMAGFEGSDLARRLGNTTGGLPFTAVFDRRGAPVQRKLGETSFDELARWVEPLTA